MANLENLKVLQANYTLISDLQPLQKLPHLRKIYCDQTPINKSRPMHLCPANPEVLVVYDSHDLKSWWDCTFSAWQEVISKAAKISRNPIERRAGEELVTWIQSILAEIHRINDLEPLQKFLKLRVVIANKTTVQDLSPIREHRATNTLTLAIPTSLDLSACEPVYKTKSVESRSLQNRKY